jgi:hypothetical protein
MKGEAGNMKSDRKVGEPLAFHPSQRVGSFYPVHASRKNRTQLPCMIPSTSASL